MPAECSLESRPAGEPGWHGVVIGAGPAGSVTALVMARLGHRVLLLDKSSFPRAKVCGCCLNGTALAALRRLGLEHVLAGGVPLTQVHLAAGRRSSVVRLPTGLALSREALDTRLIQSAIEAGVVFRPETPARVLAAQQGSRGVGFALQQTTARAVIVATGLTGNEAVAEPGSRLGGGVLVPRELGPGFYSTGCIFMATSRDGYVGLVRVEREQLDIAAAFDPGFVKAQGGLGPAAEAVLGEAGWPAPAGLAELPWKGTPRLTRCPTRLAEERLFAVGDAAGYIEPFTGEGMAWAIRSAEALGPIASRAVQGWTPALATEWERIHRGLIGSRQRSCRLFARVLRSPLLTRLALQALSLCPSLSRPFVTALNRERKARA
jgi:flavin-dependent dehydrogenase